MLYKKHMLTISTVSRAYLSHLKAYLKVLASLDYIFRIYFCPFIKKIHCYGLICCIRDKCYQLSQVNEHICLTKKHIFNSYMN